jgi:hypothetical protein
MIFIAIVVAAATDAASSATASEYRRIMITCKKI